MNIRYLQSSSTRDVIKPAVKEINELTNFFVEDRAETRRTADRRTEVQNIAVARAAKSVEPVQETFLFDIEDLPPTAIKLVQAGVSRKEALRIANQEWDAVERCSTARGQQKILLSMLKKKSGSHNMPQASKIAGGFILKAIRENYQDPVFKKQLQAEQAEEKQAMLASLKDEMLEKQNALNPTSRARRSRIARPSSVENFIKFYQRAVARL